MGLELKPSKTKISHTLNKYEGNVGFDFLGFTIRQFEVGKYESRLGFKTIITSSHKKLREHYQEMASIIESHKTAPQKALITRLNPVIRGWANYYSTVVSRDAYSELDHEIFLKLKAWATHRHPKQNWREGAGNYWHTIGKNNWIFAAKEEGDNLLRLLAHTDTPIVRHVGSVSLVRRVFILKHFFAYQLSHLSKHINEPIPAQYVMISNLLQIF